MYQDEYILGAQWAINDTWTAGVRGISREVKNGVDDYCSHDDIVAYVNANGYPDYDGSTLASCMIINPGRSLDIGIDVEGDGNLVDFSIPADVLGLPDYIRKYYALELFWEANFDNQWFLQGSYTWAHSYGNIEGYVNSTLEQDDAGLTQDEGGAAVTRLTAALADGARTGEREHRPGDSIEVIVLRAGQKLTLRATLSQRGADAAASAHAAPAAATAHASFEVGHDPAPAGDFVPTAGHAVPELMRADEPHLADLRRLTFGGDNAEAYWGPDGRTLSFQRTPPGGECDAQYLLDLVTGQVTLASSGKGRTTCGYLDYPKGDGLIYATTEAAGPACPAKPDYSQGYVWAIYDSFDIVRRDAQGQVRPLLASPGYDAEATQCFKDGRILYTSTRNGDLDLYVANADGTGIRQLTATPGYDGGAFFTPDCTRIVWRASRPTGQALADYQSLLKQGLVRPTDLEIFVMDADGRNRRQLTHDGVGSFAPYPTPDGRGVLYASNVGANPREFDLWFVSWAGKKTRITTAPGFDGFPMFSPDGRWLVFASNRANQPGQRDTDLYIARWVP